MKFAPEETCKKLLTSIQTHFLGVASLISQPFGSIIRHIAKNRETIPQVGKGAHSQSVHLKTMRRCVLACRQEPVPKLDNAGNFQRRLERICEGGRDILLSPRKSVFGY